MKVKVCGMRDKKNLKEVLALLPDFMGFIFYPESKRYVGEDFVLKKDEIDFGNCKRVGVFVDQSLEEIKRAAVAADLQVVQLHGAETPEYCKDIRAKFPELVIWKSFQVGKDFNLSNLKAYTDCVDAFLFDTASENFGGSGESFDWSLIAEYDGMLPLILAGGIGPDNVSRATELVRKGLPIVAVDLNSKVEVKPGLKSPLLLDKAIRQLK